MDNEKILSNEELLNVTGGGEFLSYDDVNNQDNENLILTMKYGIKHFPLHTVILYAVRPNK